MRTLLFLCLFLCLSVPVFSQGWDSTVEKIARQAEAKYNLPHGIAHAFNMQENSGRVSDAKPRVESGFFNVGERHYKAVYNQTLQFFKDNPNLVDSLPFDVERFQEATSWGPFQILGTNLSALGCTEDYLSEITVQEHFDY